MQKAPILGFGPKPLVGPPNGLRVAMRKQAMLRMLKKPAPRLSAVFEEAWLGFHGAFHKERRGKQVIRVPGRAFFCLASFGKV